MLAARVWRVRVCVVSNPVTPTMHPIHERYLINGETKNSGHNQKDNDHI